LAEKIKSARKELLKMSQLQFSNRLGVSQSNVSKWESGQLEPESQHLMRLANLLSGKVESFYFLEEAGVPSGFFMGDPKYAEGVLPSEIASASAPPTPFYQVPLLRDSAAAGTPRAIEDDEIESYVPCLKASVPRGSALVALRVEGDSMSPLLCDGYIVIIDTAQRDPKKLVGKMVAARDASGVTIKWLRKDNDLYMLVPQHTSPRFPITVLREGDGWGIVGAVVQWLGFPPAGKKGFPV
jgi:SOS-response transcriptional repressor LexA